MSFKDTFLSYLPNFIKARPAASELVGKIGDNLQDTWDMLQGIREVRAHITSSEGDDLDWWGLDFDIKRFPGEIDTDYKSRIFAAINPNKLTKTAIINSIKTVMKIRGYSYPGDYEIYWSEPDKYKLDIYIKMWKEGSEFYFLKDAIKKTRAGGIYAIFTYDYNVIVTVNSITKQWSGYMTTNGHSTTNSAYTMGSTGTQSTRA